MRKRLRTVAISGNGDLVREGSRLRGDELTAALSGAGIKMQAGTAASSRSCRRASARAGAGGRVRRSSPRRQIVCALPLPFVEHGHATFGFEHRDRVVIRAQEEPGQKISLFEVQRGALVSIESPR